MLKYVLSAGLVASAATALLTASPASAAAGSTVAVEQTVLVTFRAGAGQNNDVNAKYLGTSIANGRALVHFAVSDDHAIAPGAGCTAAPVTGAGNRVVCTVNTVAGDPTASLRLYLGDRDDRATAAVGTQGVQLDGGSGNDTLRSSATGYLYGRAGNDTLIGGTYADGADGNDVIRLGDPVEGKAVGGRGNDVIHGNAGHDTLFGNSGRDRIYGGRGGDELLGGPDNDSVYGNSGNDGVYGGPGKDKLSGGPGTDTVRQDGPPRQGDQPHF